MSEMTGSRPASGAGRNDGVKFASGASRVYRTVYRRQCDLDRFPNFDPARLPVRGYSESDNLDFARSDLAYLRDERDDVTEAWIEVRTVTPWERTDD